MSSLSANHPAAGAVFLKSSSIEGAALSGAAARRFSLCAQSRLRAVRLPERADLSAALNNALFFYFYTTGCPVCTAEEPPLGVLMDGGAWIPSVIQWRWTLAFVNWGISQYRFCPLCSGRRAHQSGLTIGNVTTFSAVVRWVETRQHAWNVASLIHRHQSQTAAVSTSICSALLHTLI